MQEKQMIVEGRNMARLGRTIFVTHCSGVGFDENNEQFQVEVDIQGNITDLNIANTKVRRQLKNNKILIHKIEQSSKYYSMTVEDFMKNADLVTDHK